MNRPAMSLLALLLVATVLPFTPADRAVAVPAGRVSGVACRDGQAGFFPCRGIDLAAFVPMSEFNGGRANDIWGWADPKTKREYALMGSTRGVLIIDVTVATKPRFLGRIPKPENSLVWQDVEVYKNHAFIVCDLSPCGMQVFDLTRLRKVKEEQTWTPDVVYPFTPTTHTIDINPATGFAYLNGSLTMAGGAPHIVDVSNPKVPVPAGFILDDGYTHDSHCRIYLGPDKRYQKKEICFNANEDTITIYDVTNKLAPEQLARVTYKNATYTHQAWLTQGHTHIVVSDEIDEQDHGINSTTYIFDVGDLTKPKLVGTYVAKTKAIDHNNYVVGDRIFQANYTAGLRILDASNIAQARLREIAYFDVVPESDEPVYDGAWAAYPYLPSGNVIVSGMAQGLFVLTPRV
ncbi:MAG: choice-of-anchor B family protein [Actinomycetota bacterium]|nr:choice-of-anchor B family protein [Actinomycetota bacterium]